MEFTFTPMPAKVQFGGGLLNQLGEEALCFGRQVFLIASPHAAHLAHQVASQLGEQSVGSFTKARPHTPVAQVQEAQALLVKSGANCLVAIGGGSAIGLGKLLALRENLPLVACPTTLSGSEMTSIWGIVEDGKKTTGRTDAVRPVAVVYDPTLLAEIPGPVLVTSAINAMAHACEGLYSFDIDPVRQTMAKQSIAALSHGLAQHRKGLVGSHACEALLHGSWLAGLVLDGCAMALHHKLCHVIGGLYDLPHAPLHTALLPHALAYNAPFAQTAMADIAKALGTERAAQGVYDLANGLGAEMSLEALGMPSTGIDAVLEQALSNPYPNPRPLERAALLKLLQSALAGTRPPVHPI